MPAAPVPRLRPKGVYLLVGGLGGIGLTLAQYLARTVRARLVLTGQSPLPQRNQWDAWLEKHTDDADDTTASKIRKLMELEKMGAEIAVFSADVSDAGKMKEVITAAEKRFGKINGIVHAAGIVMGGLIRQITPQQVEQGFKAKVNGTLVLDALSRDMDLDFFILCSSLNALVGTLGEVTYCAANAFQDAFAIYKTSGDRKKVFTAAVNWDAWQGVGFAAAVEKHIGVEGLFKHGILPDEGAAVFKRVLTADTPRLVVSTVELEDTFREAETLKTTPTAETLRQMKSDKPRYPRPKLSIPYAPPGNEMERMLCETWEHFLGIEQVGIHDNFFELGASSLGIVQVNSILKETLKKDIPVPTMYAFPTAAELGRYLSHVTADKAGEMPIPEETAQLEARSMGKQRLKKRKQKMDADKKG
jgi:short-subunit dehydrogenase involved in D-alanine esterification of teichoic acids